MPIIPTYSPSQQIPSTAGEVPRRPTPTITVYEEALQGLAETGVKFGTILIGKRKQAERANELSTKTLAADKELQDLDFKLRSQENFGTVVDDYEEQISEMRERYTSEISDSAVRQAFTEDFNRAYLQKRLGLQIYQRRRQADFYRASLVNNLEHLKDVMATSSGPTAELEFQNNLMRGHKMINEGVRSGIISAQEGVNFQQQWPAAALEARIENDIMTDPEQAFKDIVGGQYETLEPEKRPELERAARTEWNYRVSLQEKIDNEADKAIKKQQDANSLALLLKLGEDELDLDTLNAFGKARRIDDVQYRALYNMLTKEKTPKSVSSIVLQHVENIDAGKGDPDLILSDGAQGLLTPTDSIKLLDRLRQWNEREEKGQNEHLKWAKKYLEGRIITKGPLAAFQSPEERTALSGAIDELEARIKAEGLTGWNIRQAAIEIGESWASTELGFTAVRKVRGSRPKNLAEIEPLKKTTIQELYDGKITSEEADKDLSSLLQYEAIFERQARQVPKTQTERKK